MDKLTKTDKEAIEFFTKFWNGSGLDNISSQIMSILFVQTHEIAMDEISKFTGYSLASISNKSKFLENSSMIYRVKKPGSKKVFFTMDKDAIKMLRKKMEMNIKLFKLLDSKANLLVENYKKEKNEEKSKFIKKYYEDFEKMNDIILQGLERLK